MSVLASASPVTEEQQAVLSALARMARRSKRSQADLSAALVGAGIEVAAEAVREVVATLAKGEFVEALIPLHDGGVLLTVTSKGLALCPP